MIKVFECVAIAMVEIISYPSVVPESVKGSAVNTLTTAEIDPEQLVSPNL